MEKWALELAHQCKNVILGAMESYQVVYPEWSTIDEQCARVIAVQCTERTPDKLPTLEEWLQGLYPGADLDRLEIPARVVIEIAKSYAKALESSTADKCPSCESPDKTMTVDPFVHDIRTFVPMGHYVKCSDPWHSNSEGEMKHVV
jgi:hypothetical protein